MNGLVADTHAVLWFLANESRLSAVADAAMTETIESGGNVVVCTITLVEVAYLVEKRRIDANAFDLVATALSDPTSGFLLAPLDYSVADRLRQIPRVSVPDMPDRIIAATALHLDLPLISRDRKIQASAIRTIW